MKKVLGYTLLSFLAALFVFVLVSSHISIVRFYSGIHSLPDFSLYQDGDDKKQAFFAYLQPIIELENESLARKRIYIDSLNQKWLSGKKLSRRDIRKLAALAREFGVDDLSDISYVFEILHNRVDIIPSALVLAQAANESAWGSSRFAREGNNFFGQWCFEKGCGIVPTHRPEGAYHEVRKFSSAADSVAAYFNNINTHAAYSQVRALRAHARALQEPVSARSLASGLSKYSEKGDEYVDELLAMIQFNNLE